MGANGATARWETEAVILYCIRTTHNTGWYKAVIVGQQYWLCPSCYRRQLCVRKTGTNWQKCHHFVSLKSLGLILMRICLEKTVAVRKVKVISEKFFNRERQQGASSLFCSYVLFVFYDSFKMSLNWFDEAACAPEVFPLCAQRWFVTNLWGKAQWGWLWVKEDKNTHVLT